MALLRQFTVDELPVRVFETEREMGECAAKHAHDYILSLRGKPLNIIFAAAVSQDEFLRALFAYGDIDWSQITAFHMDEYIGVANDDPRSLVHFLVSRSLKDTPFRARRFLNGAAQDEREECERYSALLRENPPDICFTGIGDNGHLAFNEPRIADFKDPLLVKSLEIDELSKRQQVISGNFASALDVPSRAYTVTVPVLMSAQKIFCLAPGSNKAHAVGKTLTDPIDERCPASILRTHPNAALYLDALSAEELTVRI